MKAPNITPGPWKAYLDMDGRHGHLAILTEHPDFATDREEQQPYHPKILYAMHGRGNAPRAIAEANARAVSALPDALQALANLVAQADSHKCVGILWDEARASLAKAGYKA